MAIRVYTNIIEDNNHYQFQTLERKPSTALALLNRIEEVMRNLESNRGKIPQGSTLEAFWIELKSKAGEIKTRYLAKTGNLWWIRRYFSNVSHQEHLVRSIYARIESLPVPTIGFPALPELPRGVFQHLLSYLPLEEHARIAQISTRCNHRVEENTVKRAKELGYEGEDSIEAQRFIRSFHNAMKWLAEQGNNCIPNEYVVREGEDNQIDPEATLRRIKSKYEDDRNFFTELFNQHVERKILGVVTDNGLHIRHPLAPFVMRILLMYGADANKVIHIRHSNTYLIELAFMLSTPLVRYRWHPNPLHRAFYPTDPVCKEILKILLKHGANPFAPSCNSRRTNIFNSVIIHGDLELVELFCKNIDVNTPLAESSYLESAIETGNLEKVRILLENGANPHFLRENTTPICRAASYYRDIGLIRLLCQFGANPNQIYSNHVDILQNSVLQGDWKIAKALLENGANPFFLAGGRFTPFQRMRELHPRAYWLMRMGLLRFPRHQEVLRSAEGLRS